MKSVDTPCYLFNGKGGGEFVYYLVQNPPIEIK